MHRMGQERSVGMVAAVASVCVLFVFPVFSKSVQLLGLASETANYAALNVVLTVSRIHIRL